jgi:hypothetical protein
MDSWSCAPDRLLNRQSSQCEHLQPEEAMKGTIVVMLLAVTAVAQQTQSRPNIFAACGPNGVDFKTETSTAQPPAQPEPGKALVYVVEDYRAISWTSPTIKVGLDGAWMGATHDTSYLFFSVDPGEHHLCINWQSSLEQASFARLVAEPGRTYYFRARPHTFSGRWDNNYLDLDAIDPDEGQYLVASSPLMASHPKKIKQVCCP